MNQPDHRTVPVVLAVMPEPAFYTLMAIKQLAEPHDEVRTPLHKIAWVVHDLMAEGLPRIWTRVDPADGLSLGYLISNGWVESIRHQRGTANTYRLLRDVPPLSAFERLVP